MSNVNPSKNWIWNKVLRKGEQFLLHYWHPPCYSSGGGLITYVDIITHFHILFLSVILVKYFQVCTYFDSGVISVIRSLIFCVVFTFVDRCVILSFFLLVIVLSALRITDSDCPFWYLQTLLTLSKVTQI